MTNSDPAALAEDTLDLARRLVERPSLTPDDAGCQALIAERLAGCGFTVEHRRYNEVDNLWACHGVARPRLVLLGHTDVVPPGPEEHWRYPPFAAEVADGYLWGRGAADMKGSVAAMVIAAEQFAQAHPEHAGSLALLLTSDEEGPALDGTRRMVEWLQSRDQTIDYCIVGEPSATGRLGDTLRVGRRGSLSGDLTVHGRQGHVAYPERAYNPIHALSAPLAQLTRREWDRGDRDFPPTGFQISNIAAGTGADNVIPGTAEVRFNFRYGPATSADELKHEVRAVLDHHDLDYRLCWRHGGVPFRTPHGELRSGLRTVIERIIGITPEESTGGGTSDGRFVAPTGAQVIELGPCNATIHQIDERVATTELGTAAACYLAIAEALLRD